MANARSLPKPPTSQPLPAYEPPTPPSSSPKPPVDSNSAVAFKFSMASPPYGDKNAPYVGDASFVENLPCAENTPYVESTPCTKNTPARLSAAQQLYASSLTNCRPTIATLPPPTIDDPRRRGHEQPSFYKNQVSSYVQHPTPEARPPDSALPSTSQSTDSRLISSPTHVRPIGPQSPPYSGSSVSDRGLRTAHTARNSALRPNSSSYARGHVELDRSLITTEMPNFNRTSTYTIPQETRNLFPPTYVDTIKPRELRNVTTALKPPPSFEAPESITPNVVKGPPPASAPISTLQTNGRAYSLPVIVSPPPPAPASPFNAPQQPQLQHFAVPHLPVIVSPPPPPPALTSVPLSASQQPQLQHYVAPHSPSYLQPNITPQRPPKTSPAAETNRNRTSRLMNGINSLATSLGQLAVKSSVQSLLSGSSIEETIEENVAGDNGSAGLLDYLGLDATGLIPASSNSVGVDYNGGGYSEDLSTGMTVVPQFDACYGQDPSTSFSLTLPQFSVASGSTQYSPHNVNNTAIGHTYTRQPHLSAGAQQPYSQASQKPTYNPY